MTGVVLWSCYAINLLHTSSGSISGLARCGDSITLPLPNLVAKLAILLCSVLCGHYSAIQMKLFSFFFCKSTAHPVNPFHSSVCLWHLLCRHIFTFGDSLCNVNICCVARCLLCSWVILHRFYFICVCVSTSASTWEDSHDRTKFEMVKHFSSADTVVVLLQWMWLV